MAGPSIRGLGNQSGAEIGAEQAENRVNRNAAMSGVIETSISSERIFCAHAPFTHSVGKAVSLTLILDRVQFF